LTIHRAQLGPDRLRWLVLVTAWLSAAITGCAAESTDAAKRDVAGPYQTWDEVISRWIGGSTADLYVELGPPNLHPHELENGGTEMVWDFSTHRMPGQADVYGLLPRYGSKANCQIHFYADAKGIITKGEKVGCDS
jgi:hypothetical protein